MLVAVLLSVVTLTCSSQATPDCVADPENMLCCELEPFTRDCILKFSWHPTNTCSPACMKRYQSLGYECYKNYQSHDYWTNMEKNCDPQRKIEFKPPTTTYVPSYGASKAVALSEACPLASSRFVLLLLPGFLFAALF